MNKGTGYFSREPEFIQFLEAICWPQLSVTPVPSDLTPFCRRYIHMMERNLEAKHHAYKKGGCLHWGLQQFSTGNVVQFLPRMCEALVRSIAPHKRREVGFYLSSIWSALYSAFMPLFLRRILSCCCSQKPACFLMRSPCLSLFFICKTGSCYVALTDMTIISQTMLSLKFTEQPLPLQPKCWY